jgi:hypothetical protein
VHEEVYSPFLIPLLRQADTLQFAVDGSVVYGDKPVGVKKPKDSEFVQKPFGAVVDKTDKVKNIITMKDTRTPTNSVGMLN